MKYIKNFLKIHTKKVLNTSQVKEFNKTIGECRTGPKPKVKLTGKKIYVLCFHKDIETTNLIQAFGTKHLLNKYVEDRGISLRGVNAGIFEFYTAEEVKLVTQSKR